LYQWVLFHASCTDGNAAGVVVRKNTGFKADICRNRSSQSILTPTIIWCSYILCSQYGGRHHSVPKSIALFRSWDI
jgi:hypothetical protein